MIDDRSGIKLLPKNENENEMTRLGWFTCLWGVGMGMGMGSLLSFGFDWLGPERS
jgi:hypothetical protein